MAAARPTVYVGPDGTEVAKVIKEHECGLVVPNGDGRSLVDAIQRLQRQPALGRAMGLRARDALEQEFSMQHSCQRWLRLIERLARVSPPLGESRESGVRLRP
jgi:glycosyltransferase involved in cell wall biosynthesis